LNNERVEFRSVYPIIFGPFSIQKEICERGVVEGNAMLVITLVRYFKKRIERAEIDTDIAIFQI